MDYASKVSIVLLFASILRCSSMFARAEALQHPEAFSNRQDREPQLVHSYGCAMSSFTGARLTLPVEVVGHITHTTSTTATAGSFVKHASMLGNANGTAVGMAPRAQLAIYRALAIATFGAAEKGIFVGCSAGNSGPWNQSLSNGAPWMLPKAAGSTDRTIRATVRLGDGREFYGQYHPPNFSSESPLLVHPDQAICDNPRLNNTDVKSKMVVCLNFGVLTGIVVVIAGSAAIVMINGKLKGYTTNAYANVLPASNVDYAPHTPLGGAMSDLIILLLLFPVVVSAGRPIDGIKTSAAAIGGTIPEFPADLPVDVRPTLLSPEHVVSTGDSPFKKLGVICITSIVILAILIVLAYNVFKVLKDRYPEIFTFDLHDQAHRRTKKFQVMIVIILSYIIVGIFSIYKAVDG